MKGRGPNPQAVGSWPFGAGLFLGVASMRLMSALTWLWIDCTRRVLED